MSRLWLWGGLVALVALIPLALSLGGGFAGTDDQAVSVIGALAPDYHPWFRLPWRPASPEVESFLFALQAALGAGVVGYVIGVVQGREQERRIAEARETMRGADAGAGAADAAG